MPCAILEVRLQQSFLALKLLLLLSSHPFTSCVVGTPFASTVPILAPKQRKDTKKNQTKILTCCIQRKTASHGFSWLKKYQPTKEND